MTVPSKDNAGGSEVYRKQGFGGPMPLGRVPALIIVDFVNGFADPAMFGGGNIGSAIDQTVELLKIARKEGWPVAMSRQVFSDDGSDGNIFTRKVPSLLMLTENASASQIVDCLAPRPGEIVVTKQLPSAFADTGLAAWLTQRGVDTTVLAGCTTSGCVRATVLDAMGAGFIPAVVSDCVGDRALGPHEANLFDIAQKYGEVMPLQELLLAIRLQ